MILFRKAPTLANLCLAALQVLPQGRRKPLLPFNLTYAFAGFRTRFMASSLRRNGGGAPNITVGFLFKISLLPHGQTPAAISSWSVSDISRNTPLKKYKYFQYDSIMKRFKVSANALKHQCPNALSGLFAAPHAGLNRGQAAAEPALHTASAIRRSSIRAT
ncbi:hypothetical protein [Beijerinckia mobilis]|uniref:hypothetical protein n=1 Tax=Beijerinckia mobilis TaxID=231434 RepID=UPI0012EC2AC8|nr:hypothetical protein [Beijerinckia mobilis]